MGHLGDMITLESQAGLFDEVYFVIPAFPRLYQGRVRIRSPSDANLGSE